MTGEFPTQKASNAEKVSIWWRHHVNTYHNTPTCNLQHYAIISLSIYTYCNRPKISSRECGLISWQNRCWTSWCETFFRSNWSFQTESRSMYFQKCYHDAVCITTMQSVSPRCSLYHHDAVCTNRGSASNPKYRPCYDNLQAGFSLICAWTNDWVNNQNAGDMRRHRAYYDVTVMKQSWSGKTKTIVQLYLIKAPPRISVSKAKALPGYRIAHA